MDKTMTDLFELGQRLDGLPDHMRGYCEPTGDGMKVHVNALFDQSSRLHGQRIISWTQWNLARANPLTDALDRVLRQIEEASPTDGAREEG